MGKRKRYDTWSHELLEFIDKQNDHFDRLMHHPQFLSDNKYIRSINDEQSEQAKKKFYNKWRLQSLQCHFGEKTKYKSSRLIGFYNDDGKPVMLYDGNGKVIQENRDLLSNFEHIGAHRFIMERVEEEKVVNNFVPVSQRINFILIDKNKSIGKDNVKEVRLTISSIEPYTKKSLLDTYRYFQEWQKAFGIDPYDKKKKRKLIPRKDFELIKDKKGKIIDLIWHISSYDLFTVRELERGYGKYDQLKAHFDLPSWRDRPIKERNKILVKLFRSISRERPNNRLSKTIHKVAEQFMARYPIEVERMLIEYVKSTSTEVLAFAKEKCKKADAITQNELTIIFENVDKWKDYVNAKRDEFLYTSDGWRTPFERQNKKGNREIHKAEIRLHLSNGKRCPIH